MLNPWVAIESNVVPADRARVIARARAEAPPDVVAGGAAPDALRRVVLESWQRCALAGVLTELEDLPARVSLDELEERRVRSPLRAVMPLIRSLLLDSADDARHVVAICDHTGHLLWLEGSQATLRAADSIGFVPGADWSESAAGTNAPGTALAADHPIQVFAAEHYNAGNNTWMCSAAPVHDPDDGRVLGAIDLSSSFDVAHPTGLALAASVARAAEAQLRAQLDQADALALDHGRRRLRDGEPLLLASAGGRLLGSAPRPRLQAPVGHDPVTLDGVTYAPEPITSAEGYWLLRRSGGGGPGAASQPPRRRRALAAVPAVAPLALRVLAKGTEPVQVAGTPVQVSPRQLELCLVLALHPEGLTTEELRDDIYGPADIAPVTLRAELSRLRRVLGDALSTKPHRFTIPVALDALDVQQLVRAGDLAGAVATYSACVLPWSVAPGVVELRESLAGELRASLMRCRDPEVLGAWLQSPEGRTDASVARLMTSLVAPDDPRRAFATAIVDQSLRR